MAEQCGRICDGHAGRMRFGCDAECHVTGRYGTERKSIQDPASNSLVPDAPGPVDNRWMVADEMFSDFIQSHQEQRWNSYRRRQLLRERTDLRRPVDRMIHALHRYDVETERLRAQIGAGHVV